MGGSRTMEQDDKVSAAALSLSPVGSAGNNGRASLRQSEGTQSARSGVEAVSSPGVDKNVDMTSGEADDTSGRSESLDDTDGERVVNEDDNADADSTARRVSARAPEGALLSARAPEGALRPEGGHAGSSSKSPKLANNVRKIRIERMMSKAELARRANLSVLTIDRVERGYGCRMDTKRKILEALGLSLADRVRVFGEEE